MGKLNDAGISLELFQKWKKIREGTENPTKTNNPVWNWLIETKLSAWSARNTFGENGYPEEPTWCFDRFGQSTTELPDGRTIYIGGEHEDYYDPDFHIYNDVVVHHSDGSLDIYTYPKSVFPPTDFHSATLVGEDIIIIGCLGYMNQRDEQDTHVFALNTTTFAIRKLETSDQKPGWLFKHSATLLNNSNTIFVAQGEKYRGPEKSIAENIHEWQLNLNTLQWKLTKENHWPRWQYFRADKKRNLLWDFNQLSWNKSVGWKKEYDEEFIKLTDALGHEPDLEALKSLYEPPIVFERLPEREDEYNQIRLLIDGTVVRYKDERREIQVTVEGDLPSETIELLKQDFYKKLTNLVKTEWEITDIMD